MEFGTSRSLWNSCAQRLTQPSFVREGSLHEPLLRMHGESEGQEAVKVPKARAPDRTAFTLW